MRKPDPLGGGIMADKHGVANKRVVKISVKKRFLKHASARALLLLDAGNYPSRVARLLHVSPQLLHYHIKKWLRKGWIKRVLKTANVTLYRLDPQLKKKLTGGENSAYKGVRLHAYSLKFPVVEPPSRAVDWKRVRVANWTRLVGCEAGLTVEKTTRHVIVHADEVLSEDPNEATLLAILECLRLARVLEEKFGMRLGVPKLLRKPHYGVYDPIARWFAEFMEFSDDVGKIDQSGGYPERDYYYPSLAKEYLMMPLRLLGLREDMVQVKGILTSFADNMKIFGEAMHEHMTLIRALQAVAHRMEEAILEMRSLKETWGGE
jgi:hypothetical protein